MATLKGPPIHLSVTPPAFFPPPRIVDPPDGEESIVKNKHKAALARLVQNVMNEGAAQRDKQWIEIIKAVVTAVGQEYLKAYAAHGPAAFGDVGNVSPPPQRVVIELNVQAAVPSTPTKQTVTKRDKDGLIQETVTVPMPADQGEATGATTNSRSPEYEGDVLPIPTM